MTGASMASSAATRRQTRGEEIANSVTHGVGAAIGVTALVLMVVISALEGDAWKIVAASVHGASAVLLFLASTLYHAFRKPRLKRVFQVLDHAGVHLLIAGTYTPFALVTLRGPSGWSLFGLVWGLAVAGIVFESIFLERYPRLSTGSYLATGWIGVVAAGPLLQALPLAAMGWLLAGGVAYTLGVVFFALDRPYHHAVWHLFVILGAGCHFVAILKYVLPG
jgi:hemolysin III